MLLRLWEKGVARRNVGVGKQVRIHCWRGLGRLMPGTVNGISDLRQSRLCGRNYTSVHVDRGSRPRSCGRAGATLRSCRKRLSLGTPEDQYLTGSRRHGVVGSEDAFKVGGHLLLPTDGRQGTSYRTSSSRRLTSTCPRSWPPSDRSRVDAGECGVRDALRPPTVGQPRTWDRGSPSPAIRSGCSHSVLLDVISLDQSAVTYEGRGNGGEGEEVFRLALVAAVKASTPGQPRHRPLHDPAMSAHASG